LVEKIRNMFSLILAGRLCGKYLSKGFGKIN